MVKWKNYQAAVELGEFLLPLAVDVFGKSLELMAFVSIVVFFQTQYSLLISAYDGVLLSTRAREYQLRYNELFKLPHRVDFVEQNSLKFLSEPDLFV